MGQGLEGPEGSMGTLVLFEHLNELDGQPELQDGHQLQGNVEEEVERGERKLLT